MVTRTWLRAFLGSVACLAVTSMAAKDPSDPIADARCYRIMELLAASPVECPFGDLPRWAEDRVVFCGSSAFEAKAIRKAIEGEFGEGVALERKRDRQRWVYNHRGLLWDVVIFDARDIVVVGYVQRPLTEPSCPDAEASALLDLDGLPPIEGEATSAEPPRLVRMTDPIYPETARAARREGRVILRATIGKDGTVKDACVAASSRRGYGFEEAALAAVRTRLYEPAMLDGEPIAVFFTLTVDFKLRIGSRSLE